MKKILALYGSSRRHGNSELLADRLVEGLEVTRIFLAEQRITPIVDKRHDPEGFTPLDDDYDQGIIQQVIAADILVFATPLYWYGVSGPMKDFLDRWSQSLRDKRFDLRGALPQKEAYVVIAGGPDARIKGLPLVQQFNHICEFVKMPLVDYVIGRGGKPGDVVKDEAAMAQLAVLNRALREKVQG